MTNRTITMTSSLYDYLLSVSLREASVLKHLRQTTSKLPDCEKQISPEEGQFLAFLVQLIGARKTLELGTYTGYSALAVALALPANGKVVTLDIDEKTTKIAKDFWMQAGVSHKIELKIGSALETLDQLIKNGEENSFDFAFIDADKGNYIHYYEKALKLVRKGGVIAVDNVLWHGFVADPNAQDKRTNAIREFNKQVHLDERVTLSMVPIADGITLLRKR